MRSSTVRTDTGVASPAVTNAPGPRPPRRLAVLASVVVLAVVGAVAQGEEPETDTPPAIRYLGPDEVSRVLADLATSLPTGAHGRLETYGRSASGRPLHALVLGPPRRPAVLVHGGLGDRDAAGTVACVELARRLARDAAKDFDGLTWVLVPVPNPDGLAAFLEGGVSVGREDLRIDRDRDGRRGEDGPSDVDGDGLVLWMRIPRSDGRWRVGAARPLDPRRDGAPAEAVTGDPRLLVKDADARDAVRYHVVREGLDADADGEVGEDPPALDLTRQMAGTFDGVGPWTGDGPFPGFAPETRALMDLSLAHPTLIAWYGFTSIGTRLLRANERGNAADVDASAYERLGKDLADATGLFLRRAGGDNAGSDLDWAANHLGLLAVRVPVGRIQRHPRNARPGDDPDELDRLLWNDDALGGAGFRDFQPFDHPTLGPVEIGGFLPRTMLEPTDADLPAAVDRVCEAPRRHAAHRPRLDLDVTARTLSPGLLELEVIAVNRGDGALETNVAREAKIARPVHVRIVPRDGVERIGGPAVARLRPYGPGERSETARILLRIGDAQRGTVVARLVATHRVGGDLEREVVVP